MEGTIKTNIRLIQMYNLKEYLNPSVYYESGLIFAHLFSADCTDWFAFVYLTDELGYKRTITYKKLTC